MIYQEYYQKANFEKVWAILHEVYGEKEDSKPLYNEVFDAIRAMGIDQSLPNETIKIRLRLFGDKKAHVQGAPDPQEWLVDRKVEIVGFHIHYMTDCFVNTVTAHLLYWSTLYGIKTRAMERAEFQKWLTNISAGPYYTLPDNDIKKIDSSYMLKYIFLDFDGVLNTEQYQAQLAIEGKETKDKYGPLFDPKAVEKLAEIIEKTKAEIVVTSSWQNIHSADVLEEMWEKRCLPGEISTYHKNDSEQISHAQVVKDYLEHKTNVPYVILDDEAHYPEEFQENLIRINPVTGIKAKDVAAAIELLNIYDEMPRNAFVDIDYKKERERIGDINAESCDRKKLHYWKQTILCDGPYNWSDNLVILQKKIEYNIGYFRLTQRFEGWEHTVSQMVKACKLISIVLGHDRHEAQPYVNPRNHVRFNIDSTYLEKENPTFSEYWKKDLRKAKAYKLLWQLLSKDMKEWWD